MAIVIKGDMPKNCDECNIKWCCPIRFETRKDKTSRHPSCPIIGEIPDEHGDLIDRNTLKSKTHTASHLDGWKGVVLGSDIDSAPVILEASR